jgi:hypothetical protein
MAGRGRDFWAFGSPDDFDEEEVIAPGFRYARAIPADAPYGKQLSCRSCGALIAATDNAINRHTTFHNRLAAAVQQNLGMNFPNRFAQAETPEVPL